MERATAAWLGFMIWVVTTPAVFADDKEPGFNPKQFRRVSVMLLEDPFGDHAEEISRLIHVYVIQSPDVAVMIGQEEMTWAGKDDKRKFQLLAAYLAGNAQSQLHSGSKRNDRYSGLLYLFQVYRTMQAKDKDFRIPEVDNLLKLHKEDKLVPHLAELEKKQPTKLTPEQEAEIQKLLKKKD